MFSELACGGGLALASFTSYAILSSPFGSLVLNSLAIMDYAPIIEKKRQLLTELDAKISAPGFYDDNKAAAEVMREHTRARKVLEDWETFTTAKKNLVDNQEIAKGDDEELAEMAAEEIPELEALIEKLDGEIQYALLPRDPSEDRDAIVEIRAGTGGDEASLFAGELFKMYQSYSESRSWKVEVLEVSESDVGGMKDATFRVAGDEVFRFLKYESGVHRVQRVPATETQGRIHTSTATVAVLPEAEEVDVELRPEDLKIEACRASGPGGQGVNTTDSAVQIWHHPTGLYVKCKEGRSQAQNKERALQILRAKILEHRTNEENAKYSEQRRNLIGSGGREEKIRTYNFPQGRITDHRIGHSVFSMDAVFAGDINEFTEKLQAAEMAEKLKDAGITDSDEE